MKIAFTWFASKRCHPSRGSQQPGIGASLISGRPPPFLFGAAFEQINNPL